MLHKLSRFALGIFGGSEQTPIFRPDDDYTAVVHNATSLILGASNDLDPIMAQPDKISSLQAFFDFMEDPTWDWDVPVAGEQQIEWRKLL